MRRGRKGPEGSRRWLQWRAVPTSNSGSALHGSDSVSWSSASAVSAQHEHGAPHRDHPGSSAVRRGSRARPNPDRLGRTWPVRRHTDLDAALYPKCSSGGGNSPAPAVPASGPEPEAAVHTEDGAIPESHGMLAIAAHELGHQLVHDAAAFPAVAHGDVRAAMIQVLTSVDGSRQ